jgi:hypothetical protein
MKPINKQDLQYNEYDAVSVTFKEKFIVKYNFMIVCINKYIEL